MDREEVGDGVDNLEEEVGMAWVHTDLALFLSIATVLLKVFFITLSIHW